MNKIANMLFLYNLNKIKKILSATLFPMLTLKELYPDKTKKKMLNKFCVLR